MGARSLKPETADQGLEPRILLPESSVLPLHQSAFGYYFSALKSRSKTIRTREVSDQLGLECGLRSVRQDCEHTFPWGAAIRSGTSERRSLACGPKAGRIHRSPTRSGSAKPPSPTTRAGLACQLTRRRLGATTGPREEGLKDDRCERCGISEWQGRPNCHSQTENWGGRNRKRSKAA